MKKEKIKEIYLESEYRKKAGWVMKNADTSHLRFTCQSCKNQIFNLKKGDDVCAKCGTELYHPEPEWLVTEVLADGTEVEFK